MIDFTNSSARNFRVVLILSVNLKNLTAIGIDQLEEEHTINLAHSVGGFTYIPDVNEVWSITAIESDWVLKDRVSQQNPNIPGTLERNSIRLVRPKGTLRFIDKDGDWGERLKEIERSLTPEWVPVILPSGFHKESWSPDVGAYLWPNGKVEWQGSIFKTGNFTQNVAMFEIPKKVLPKKNMPFSVPCYSHNGGPLTARVDFTTGSHPTSCYVYHGGYDKSWVGVNGCFYYI